MIKHKLIPNIDPEFFLSRIVVDKESECWNWNGTVNINGYGHLNIKIDNKWTNVLTHRVSFKIFNGYLTEGLVIDHKCRNRLCCNPDHIREVTPQVNSTENSTSMGAVNIVKTHCKKGHEFTPDNIIVRNLKNDRKGRDCLICKTIRNKNRYIKESN